MWVCVCVRKKRELNRGWWVLSEKKKKEEKEKRIEKKNETKILQSFMSTPAFFFPEEIALTK